MDDLSCRTSYQPPVGAVDPLSAAWSRLAAGTDDDEASRVAADSEGRYRFEQATARLAALRDPRSVYVAAFGVDRYARLRSVLTPSCVEQLVEQALERLRHGRGATTVGLLAPDVFAMAFHAGSLREAVETAEKARCAAAGVYRVGDHQLDVSITGGLSLGGPVAALVQEAEVALEAARAASRPAAVFDAATHAATLQSLSLMPELRADIARGALRLEHQPKLDLRARRICGVETLVRWDHPRLGAVSPDVFVSMAEETGDIAALTQWVLERALAEQAALAARGARVDFAINLSGRLIGERSAVDTILATTSSAQGPVTFEITETAIIPRPEVAIANLQRLSAARHRIAIDDYGAGLSSLSYLKRLPADELKLDRALIKDIKRGRRDALLVRSTIDLAHALDMKVVAEGVEDDATAALLVSLGCDVAQGWLIGKPLGFAALCDLFGPRPGASTSTQRTAA